MFNLDEVGPAVNGNTARLGIYLPSISPDKGFSVQAYLIKKAEQFVPDVKADRISLDYETLGDNHWGDIAKDYWKAEIPNLDNGEYIYRYEITGPSKTNTNNIENSIYIGDPFARDTSSGVFSEFTIGNNQGFSWGAEEDVYKIPRLEDAVIYELMVSEFNSDFDGIAQRLPYLKSLGVNVIELMPVTSIAEPTRWGYMPIFYLAPEERYGGRSGLMALVRACHREGIAVIIDMVYAHTDFMFPYNAGYDRFYHLWHDHEYDDNGVLKQSPNPLVCAYNNFGNKNDFRMKSALEFFKAVNRYWIDVYHVDGFRYDHVNGYLDRTPVRSSDGNIYWYSQENRPKFTGLRELSLDSYAHTKTISRYSVGNNRSGLIQIAEDLNDAPYQTSDNGSAINGCWNKKGYFPTSEMAQHGYLDPSLKDELLLRKNEWNESGVKQVEGNDIAAYPIQYIESHDESRLAFKAKHGVEWVLTDKTETQMEDGRWKTVERPRTGFDFDYGLDESQWKKLRPYAIALMTSVGVPMLWQGQEFAENYGLSSDGFTRVRGQRPIHWSYFYNRERMDINETVLPLTQLYRKLGRLRGDISALRAPRSNVKIEYEHCDDGMLAYRRWSDNNSVAIVVLNFSEFERQLWIEFGHAGTWHEQINEDVLNLNPGSTWDKVTVTGHNGLLFTI